MNRLSERPVCPPASNVVPLVQRPLQHYPARDDARQQQQSNGIPEFQPRAQQGGFDAAEDRSHTLTAYLARADKAGDMPTSKARMRLVPEERPLRRNEQQG